MGYTPLGFTSYAQAFPFPLSALFTWVYNNTRGSLFLMILFHAVSDSARLRSWLLALLGSLPSCI